MASGFGNSGFGFGGATSTSAGIPFIEYGGSRPNYSALPEPSAAVDKLFYVISSQGTKWLPGSLGGTYYPSGWYYSNGISYTYQETPFQASQATVNAGTNTDQFLTPATYTNSDQRRRVFPSTDNATAFQILRADGTTVLFNADTLNRLFQIGDIINGNYTLFESNGIHVSKGSAITWRDEYPAYLLPVSGAAAPDSVAHTVGGVTRQFYAFDGGNQQEILSGSFEIAHDMVLDTAMKALGYLPETHMHWRPATTGTGVVVFYFDWEYSPPEGDPIPQTTLSFTFNISTPQQYRHLLTAFGYLPNLNFVVGGKIGFNIRRNPSGAQDTYTGDILLEQISMHVPCDTLGSRQIYVK